jgi:hypothetical protein
MRLLSSATWTSGEPVSVSARLKSLISLDFCSLRSAIGTRPSVPQGLPAQPIPAQLPLSTGCPETSMKAGINRPRNRPVGEIVTSATAVVAPAVECRGHTKFPRL